MILSSEAIAVFMVDMICHHLDMLIDRQGEIIRVGLRYAPELQPLCRDIQQCMVDLLKAHDQCPQLDWNVFVTLNLRATDIGLRVTEFTRPLQLFG